MIRIEPAGAAAAALLAALHGECFADDPWDAAAIGRLFALPGCFARIARIGEAPAGFLLALDLGEECEVLALGVVPGRRRQGVGRALLDDLCTAAAQRGAGALLLEVAQDNSAARALYARAGFVAIGCRRSYYRRGTATVAALVLRRPLAPPSST